MITFFPGLGQTEIHTIRFEVSSSWIQSLPGNKMSPLTISPNIHPTDQMSTGRWGGGGRKRGRKEGGGEREGGGRKREGGRGEREGGREREKEGERKGGRKEREGRRERGREGGKRGREGGRERVEGYDSIPGTCVCSHAKTGTFWNV